MDIPCCGCGEPWEMDEVLHGSPSQFVRDGAKITRCPSCRQRRPRLTIAERDRLQALSHDAELFGEDLDGFAANWEDRPVVIDEE